MNNGLNGIHVRIAGPGRAGSMGAVPWSGVSDGLVVVLLFGDDGRGGAPCELTLAHALQAGIHVDPTGQGRLWTYESRYTTLFNTSHPHHRQDSDLPAVDHISASIESSTVLVPHASLSGRNAGCLRTGRSSAADGPGLTSLGPHAQWARPQRPPRASKDERPTARRRRGMLGLLGLGSAHVQRGSDSAAAA